MLFKAISILMLILLLPSILASMYHDDPILGVMKCNPPREFMDVYLKLRFLEDRGINVSKLAFMLKEAMVYLDRNDTKRAYSIINDVLSKARDIESRLNEIIMERWIGLGVRVAIGVGIVIALYMVIKRIVPLIWIRFRGRSVVVYRGDREVRKTLLYDPEVLAVILAIVIVAGVFAIAQFLRPAVVEPFSAIGLLGPKGKIGGYPKVVVVGDEIKLYVYIHNYLGHMALYKVLVKVDRGGKLGPSPQPPIDYFYVLTVHNENLTIPYTFKVFEPGRQRLVFELWIYNETTRNFTFHGRWVHLWFNATSP